MELTPEYKKYIEDSRKSGMTDIQIRGALMNAGWKDNQVAELFDAYKKQEQGSSVEIPKPTVNPLQKPELGGVNSFEIKKTEEKKEDVKDPVINNLTSSSASSLPSSGAISSMPVKKEVVDSSPKPVGTTPNELKENPNQINHSAYTPQNTDVNQGGAMGGGIRSYSGMPSMNRTIPTQAAAKPTNTMPNPTVQKTNPEPNVVIKEGGSGFKKILFIVLFLAIVLGGVAYGYTQFINPFVLKKDEVLIMDSISQILNSESAVRFENDISLTSNSLDEFSDIPSGEARFLLDFDYGGANYKDRWNLRVYGFEIDAGEDPMIGMISGVLETIDVQLRYINSDMYLYPGALTSFLGDDVKNMLFEKWVKFTPEKAEGIASEGGVQLDTQSIEDVFNKLDLSKINYLITDSYVENLEKHIKVKLTSEALAQYISSMNLGQSVDKEDFPDTEYEFVIDKSGWLKEVKTTATSRFEDLQTSVTSISKISKLDANYSINPPGNIVPIDDVTSLIFGSMSGQVIESQVVALINAMHSVAITEEEGDFSWICDENNKIKLDSEKANIKNAFSNILEDQSGVNCYSSTDAYVIEIKLPPIEGVEEEATLCIDSTKTAGTLYTADENRLMCI